MTAITTRAGKGSALTNAELDANFTNLNAGKAELAGLATQDFAAKNMAVSSVNGGQLAGTRRRNLNGDCSIAQAGTSFPAVANLAWTLDGYRWEQNSGAVLTLEQALDAPADNEFQFSLRTTVTTASAAPTAVQYAMVCVFIEGYDVRDFIGKPFTISFWVRSAKTGVHCLSLRNSGYDRTYVAEYTVNAVNTWEKKTITIASGLITAGTWDWTSGSGLRLHFMLAAGAIYQTSAGAWQVGSNLLATVNQVNCLDTVGNIFAITGLQVEPGSVGTQFEHGTYQSELAFGQRYYRSNRNATGVCRAADVMAFIEGFDAPMRAAPSIVLKTTTPYVESPIFFSSFSGSGSAITATHTSVYGCDVQINGFTGLTTGAHCLFAKDQVSYSARLP